MFEVVIERERASAWDNSIRIRIVVYEGLRWELKLKRPWVSEREGRSDEGGEGFSETGEKSFNGNVSLTNDSNPV